MNKLKLSFIMIVVATLGVSCQRDDITDVMEGEEPNYGEEIRIVPVDEALATLDCFLSGDGTTRSGNTREIESISVYYRLKASADGMVTRSGPTTDVDDTDYEPAAYLVNFADNGGFAVLGANSDVDEIVAVTENGHIDNDLNVTFEEEGFAWDDDDIEEEYDPADGDIVDTQTDSVDVYCAEDDDFYCGVPIEKVIRTLLLEAIKLRPRHNPDDPVTPPGGGGSTNNPPVYSTKLPLLNYSWGQRYPYNKYCWRRNGFFHKKRAYVGCSAVAMSMIMARNEFPQSLTVNGRQLDWAGMKTGYKIMNLSETSKDDLARLMGSVYNKVGRVATEWFTLITPEQIKKRMEAMGYANVKKYSDNDFTKTMIKAASDMLNDDKPVFISAIPPKVKNWESGHSWVIDGAKYSSGNSGNYLFHFNFGWQGSCNGYFTTSCLNPAKGVEYDGSVDPKQDYKYTWHFRLITYNIPVGRTSRTVNF